MEIKNKSGTLLFAAALFASVFGLTVTKKANVNKSPILPVSQTDEKINLNEKKTASEICPALFSKSSDEYLVSQAKQSEETKCFVSGCGGSL